MQLLLGGGLALLLLVVKTQAFMLQNPGPATGGANSLLSRPPRARMVVTRMSATEVAPLKGPGAAGPLPVTGGRKRPDPEKAPSYLDLEDEVAPSAPQRLEGDLLGDGGVIKTVLRAGDGPVVSPGSEVTLDYVLKVKDTGMVLCRGENYRCIQGDGTMIGGWETAVGSMRVGEKASVLIQPWWGYGDKGVPPVVGPGAALELDVEVKDSAGNFMNPKSFRDVDPKKLRDLASISEDYERRSELRMRNEEGLSDVDKAKKWFSSLYFFGFFEGTTGERPPWYLTPTITFPAMFLAVALTFYVLVTNGGVAIKRDLPVEDIELSAALLQQVFG